MAQRGQDLLSRLADRGEEAFKKFPDMPGAARLLDVTTNLRERVDELQKRMRGYEELTKRVEALERRLDQTPGGGTRSARKPASRAAAGSASGKPRKSSARPKSRAPKRPGGSGRPKP